MIRLLVGCNCLRVNKDMNLERKYRTCMQCDMNVIEDSLYFIMFCPAFHVMREQFFTTLRQNVTYNSMTLLQSLPPVMKLYIFLGMSFPIDTEDLTKVRYYSLLFCHMCYTQRKNM